MPKRNKRRRKPASLHATRSRPAPRTAPAGGGEEPPLLGDVGRMLRGPHPQELLHLTSSVLAMVDPRGQDALAPPNAEAPELTLAELAGSFIGFRSPETTALLAAIAELADDELVRRRIRRELDARDDPLPRWLRHLAPLTADRALEMVHVLGDGDNVLLAVRTGNDDPLTVVVYIDHNLGSVAKDGFVIHEPVERVAASFHAAAGDDPDTAFREIDLADARARITEAIELGAITFPPLETDTWPAARPFVEWVLRHLPEGGRGYERPAWTDTDRAALTDRFFASEFGADRDGEDRELFHAFLWFGCDYGPGDPLRWSPVAVEMLLADWLPRKVVADAAFLERAPDLLRRFIRYSHRERDIRPELTTETLDAVDRWESDYLRAVRSPRPQGPAALLAAMGVGDAEDLDATPWSLWDAPYEEAMLELLREDVGGDAALRQLDGSPLPDESLDLSGVPEDVHAKVADVDARIDGCCRQLLDTEHRTACRRLLHDLAAAEPDIFRRRGRADTAAAAIAWMVVKANHGFSQREGGLTAKALGAWFGVGTNPAQRAPTFLQALGMPARRGYSDVTLGSPRYLVASRRRWIIDRRDRCHTKA